MPNQLENKKSFHSIKENCTVALCNTWVFIGSLGITQHFLQNSEKNIGAFLSSLAFVSVMMALGYEDSRRERIFMKPSEFPAQPQLSKQFPQTSRRATHP